jgi:multisubunit Na+/H+ antiporter MnhE subunit
MGVYVGITSLLLFIIFPITLVLFNKSYSPKQKLVGVLVSVFFSWLGFIVFYLMMIVEKRTQTSA